MNAWTVGLAGGLLEGAPIRLATEIARVVDDGPNMHVLPIVTRGATENLNSLLYLRGVDMAIINSDALEEYKVQVPEIQHRIVYLLNLFPSELHIFVRPEIASLQDLAGKKVNFNTQGTAAAYSGPLIFSRLGIDVEKTFIPHQVALEQMRKGEMAAVVFITSKPVDAFVRGRWEPGFKFLPVAYESKFEDYYLPAVLEANEYPNLIKQGERVSTIAVPTVLVAFNWPAQSNRYQRVARFVDYLFSRIDRLQAPGFDPKWKSINLAATVPGLARSHRRRRGWIVRPVQSRHRNEDRSYPALIAFGWQAELPSHKAERSDGAASRLLPEGARGAAECLEAVTQHRSPGAAGAGGRRLDRSARPPRLWTIRRSSGHHDISRGAEGSAMQLSIHCRSGRTELVVAGTGHLWPRRRYAISYRVNDNQPVQVAAATPSFGTGAAFTGDVVRLLQSLPEEGEVAIRLSPRAGAAHEGHSRSAG